MQKSIVLLLALILSSAFVAAKPLGETIVDFFGAVMDVIGYVFGMQFLGSVAGNVKVQIITRLSVFLIVLILIYELVNWRGHGLRSGAAKTVAFALALMTSFAIGPATLSGIAALWGGLLALLLYLTVILILYAIMYVIPSTSSGPIILKIFVLLIILLITNTQLELIERSGQVSRGLVVSGEPIKSPAERPAPVTERRPPFRASVVGPTGDVVSGTPLYYPPRYPQQYRGK